MISKMSNATRVVGWFSAGAASAVACKLMLQKRKPGQQISIVNVALTLDEHPDNERFLGECEAWFGVPILRLQSSEYPNGCFDVWSRRRYMAGVAGAVCTTELKKRVRQDFERQWEPHAQAFGYTIEEKTRADRFRANNPEVRLLTPLIEMGLTKADCLSLIDRAGIAIPAMYKLGFSNNNCIGCVKAQSPSYWNRVRRHFPERFARIAALADEIGAKLVRVDDARIPLSLLDPGARAGEREPEMDCSLLCAIAEQDMRA